MAGLWVKDKEQALKAIGAYSEDQILRCQTMRTFTPLASGCWVFIYSITRQNHSRKPLLHCLLFFLILGDLDLSFTTVVITTFRLFL